MAAETMPVLALPEGSEEIIDFGKAYKGKTRAWVYQNAASWVEWAAKQKQPGMPKLHAFSLWCRQAIRTCGLPRLEVVLPQEEDEKEEELEENLLPEGAQIILKFGQHRGKTREYVFRHDRDYCRKYAALRSGRTREENLFHGWCRVAMARHAHLPVLPLPSPAVTRKRKREDTKSDIKEKLLPEPIVGEPSVKEDSNERACRICLDRAVNTVCLPCSHSYLCVTCSLRLFAPLLVHNQKAEGDIAEKLACSMCKQLVQKVQRVYYC